MRVGCRPSRPGDNPAASRHPDRRSLYLLSGCFTDLYRRYILGGSASQKHAATDIEQDLINQAKKRTYPNRRSVHHVSGSTTSYRRICNFGHNAEGCGQKHACFAKYQACIGSLWRNGFSQGFAIFLFTNHRNGNLPCIRWKEN